VIFIGLEQGFEVGDFLDFFGFFGEVIWLARGFAGTALVDPVHYKRV